MTRNMEKSCTERGAAWAGSWDPLQAGGVGGRNGDRVCQIAATELRASNIPNKEFPMGLQVTTDNTIHHNVMDRLISSFVRSLRCTTTAAGKAGEGPSSEGRSVSAVR